MYELLWYLFVTILEGSVALKTSRAEYRSCKQYTIISADGVYVLFQYFLIYFNYLIQNAFSTFKAVGEVLQTLFPSYWKEKYYPLKSKMYGTHTG